MDLDLQEYTLVHHTRHAGSDVSCWGLVLQTFGDILESSPRLRQRPKDEAVVLSIAILRSSVFSSLRSSATN